MSFHLPKSIFFTLIFSIFGLRQLRSSSTEAASNFWVWHCSCRQSCSPEEANTRNVRRDISCDILELLALCTVTSLYNLCSCMSVWIAAHNFLLPLVTSPVYVLLFWCVILSYLAVFCILPLLSVWSAVIFIWIYIIFITLYIGRAALGCHWPQRVSISLHFCVIFSHICS